MIWDVCFYILLGQLSVIFMMVSWSIYDIIFVICPHFRQAVKDKSCLIYDHLCSFSYVS